MSPTSIFDDDASSLILLVRISQPSDGGQSGENRVGDGVELVKDGVHEKVHVATKVVLTTERLRKRHRPAQVRLLFAGEAPPAVPNGRADWDVLHKGRMLFDPVRPLFQHCSEPAE
jgi:hypothetical protein